MRRNSRVRQPVDERLSAFEGTDALDRGAHDLADRLVREEGLVAGHDHVRERHQALDHVVQDHGRRQVLEEQRRLLLVDIDRQPAQLTAFQRLHRRFGVDQPTAAGIDQHAAAFEARQRRRADDVMGVLEQRTVQRHHIAAGQQCIHAQVGAAERFEGRRRTRVVPDQRAAEAGHDAGEDEADLAGADHAHGLAVQIKTHQAVELEIAIARAHAGARDLAIDRQQQAHRELGHRVRRVIGDAYDRDAEPLGGAGIDMVDPGRAGRHQARALRRQQCQHPGVEVVIDEHADRVATLRQERGGGIQSVFQEQQFMAGILVGQRQHRLVIPARTEYGCLHACSWSELLADCTSQAAHKTGSPA